MSQKNIDFKSHKAESLNEKKNRSSQHSKFKKSMADQLRAEIRLLIQKKDFSDVETLKSYKNYEKWKTIGT